MATDTPGNTGPWFIAEQTALDFINTVAMTDKGAHDFFQTDEDVYQWLLHAGVTVSAEKLSGETGELLNEARNLRELIRLLVEEKKKGNAISPEHLNDYLRHVISYPRLISEDDGALRVTRCFPITSASQAMGILAEHAADLLATGNFEYIRQCEHPDCSLWFYDRTKSHRRRWCSMALCGNRAKIARFRQNHVDKK
ncbi:CGNR zinc finger domain-containing protein [Pantoea cypripedii]|uniref:Zinc finger CGNR domain-containing protein n=1 Tax=Pantoea cypripedii TaxID=55209 RepID=A0A6B9G8Z9_PANCY|nr:ABATE domain-containing protein [Pantoea cypripedii]QGY32323.1 hypothetical protein CUN67_25390 [Pantoea cypripedii]